MSHETFDVIPEEMWTLNIPSWNIYLNLVREQEQHFCLQHWRTWSNCDRWLRNKLLYRERNSFIQIFDVCTLDGLGDVLLFLDYFPTITLLIAGRLASLLAGYLFHIFLLWIFANSYRCRPVDDEARLVARAGSVWIPILVLCMYGIGRVCRTVVLGPS